MRLHNTRSSRGLEVHPLRSGSLFVSILGRSLLFGAVCIVILASEASLATPLHRSAQLRPISPWGLKRSESLSSRITLIRGGSSVQEEDEYEDEDEYDSDEEEEEESDEEEEEEEEEVEDDDSSGVQIEVKVEKYDEVLYPNPMTNLYASLGVMMIGRKIDLFTPIVVRVARAAFIAYLVLNQLFLLYARIRARSINDRTPIELKNPLSSVLQSQLGEGGSNGMVKDLASSFLSSKSTVMEYDLKQVRSMQSGVILNMCFMWFLHFKMGQVQPLLIQTVTGLSNMIYSPLFQVYVMGRNLERPFKNPALKGMEAVTEEKASKEATDEKAPEIEVDETEEDGDDDAKATSTEEDSDDEEEDEESDDEDSDEESDDEDSDDE